MPITSSRAREKAVGLSEVERRESGAILASSGLNAIAARSGVASRAPREDLS